MNDESYIADRSPSPGSRRLLRGLLIVTFCLGAVSLGAVGYKYYKQATLIEAVINADGGVGMESVGPDWIRRLVGEEAMWGFDTVQRVSVDLNRSDISLNDLAVLRDLRDLSICGGYNYHAPAPHRRWNILRSLDSLHELQLINTGIRDNDLTILSELKNLRSLALVDEPFVTNNGLQHLERLSKLRALSLNSTGVSEDGAEAFGQRRPECKVTYKEKEAVLKGIWE